jgi:hypothetical protein
VIPLLSLATPAGNGAIGAACEVPETAAKITPATAIAKIVRVISILLGRTMSAAANNALREWQFRVAGMNGLTAFVN